MVTFEAMKNSFVLLLFGLLSLAVVSCKETEEEKRQKAVTLMTTQTLGLAYLEELKLDDAEREFQKYIELAPGDKLGYANLGLVYLRMGKYPEAQEQLEKAHGMDQEDPDVSLLLATVYQMQGDKAKAISLLERALSGSPDHPKVLFDLCALYSTDPSEDAAMKRQEYLEQLEASTPGNLVPLILLAESYIKQGENDKATALLERLPAEFPAFPKESIPYYDETLALLRDTKAKEALLSFMVFHNYQKVTFPYQSGMTDLKGPGESAIGFPLITYNEQAAIPGGDNTAILEVIKFTEVTSSTGLEVVPVSGSAPVEDYTDPVYLAVADYDGDGDSDVYLAAFDRETGVHTNYLFQNELGRYHDVAESVGIGRSGLVRSVSFADYDNDGYLDLYLQQREGNALYRNADKGQFEERAESSGVFADQGMRHALFADLDHDGDLDLFETGKGTNRAFRNNGDGTFEERTEAMGLLGPEDANGGKSAFGDFDDDGDLDLLVLNQGSAPTLFTNERQGVFRDITDSSGLSGLKGASAVAVGDYDNDGFLDLLVGNPEGRATLLRNDGKGGFRSSNALKVSSKLEYLNIRDLKFLDFDNDGYLDILLAGIPGKDDSRGLYLYHNSAEGTFKDVSHLLPDHPVSVSQIAVFDYNEDGDMDLLLAGSSGGVYLLRNDGGNMNHYLNMKLVGLRTGSAKNNFFGIGAKVEMRAGDLYQSRVVTDPNIYFGLGNRSKADVIRITWTNGVPQNILLPEADQALVEEQVLKGSCPFLYAWNGQRYEFVKDITWRSALGMPLGIMGGNTMYAFADASDDYIKIPGEMLREEDGSYRIQVTSELWETIYMDRIRLVAVDHPDSVEVFVPEQFSPPPFPGMDLWQVGDKWAPVSAADDQGRDQLASVSAKDDQYVAGFKPGVYQGLTEFHDLILDPGQGADPANLQLFLRGWIFPTDASINTAMSQSDNFGLVPPSVQVVDKDGSWKTVIAQMGFPMGKDKTVIVDLSGKFLSEDLRIRLRTNMEIYWDQAFFARAGTPTPVKTSFMEPVHADLRYRGFSKSYRKGSYGPHWFDYEAVSTERKWRDLTGNYTRYGDVLPLLLASDNQYVISNAGDEVSIHFNAAQLPVLPRGWKRDFLIHSVGWVKDGDLNTAHGNTVEPLPYHGMKSYPPAEDEAYPADQKLKQYKEKYNTRQVTMEDYRNRWIK